MALLWRWRRFLTLALSPGEENLVVVRLCDPYSWALPLHQRTRF
jgi:hypothetical protein